MANDICSVIHVTENIEEFKKAILTEDNAVDLNQVVPMPQDLNIQSGSSSYRPVEKLNFCVEGSIGNRMDMLQSSIQLILENFYKEDKTQEQYITEVLDETVDNPYWECPIERDNERIREDIKCKAGGYYNLQKYGYKDWYDFCNVEWGTKWNVYEEETCIRENNNGLFIDITTANGSPMGIFKELAKKFNFTVAFSDRDNCGCNLGIVYVENGEVLVQYFDDDKLMTEDDCWYLSDKICDIGYAEDEERPYKLSEKEMEQLDNEIEPFLF